MGGVQEGLSGTGRAGRGRTSDSGDNYVLFARPSPQFSGQRHDDSVLFRSDADYGAQGKPQTRSKSDATHATVDSLPHGRTAQPSSGLIDLERVLPERTNGQPWRPQASAGATLVPPASPAAADAQRQGYPPLLLWSVALLTTAVVALAVIAVLQFC